MREMRRRLSKESVNVHDVELVTVDAEFHAESVSAMLEPVRELGAKRLRVCGDDPDRSRQVASLPDAVQVVAAGRRNGGVPIGALHLSRISGSPGDLLSGMGALPLYKLFHALPDDSVLSIAVSMGGTAPPAFKRSASSG